MNERIKELVGRAEAYAYEHEEHWHDGPDWQELFNKKFAELIVRECMDLLEDYTTDVHVGGIQYNVLSADETLQKHFGVERD